MDELFVFWTLPFLSWNYETKAWPRGATVGVRLLDSRNVPGSDVRSQSGVEPLLLAEPTFLPPPVPAGLKLPRPRFPSSSAPERVTQVDDSGKDAGTTGGATVDHARPRSAVSKRKLTSKLASRASTNLAAGPSCRCTRRGRQARGVAPSSRRSDASAARNDAACLSRWFPAWGRGDTGGLAATTSSLSAPCRVLGDLESIPASDGCGESLLDWMGGHGCTSRWI